MSIITAKGREVKKAIEIKEIDLKTVFIRLKKDGDSLKVRLLSPEDYVEYKAHSDFKLGLYTTPCIAPHGDKCALCEASKSGVEGYDRVYAKRRYLFAFVDIENGEIRVFDASKTQAVALIADIDEMAADYDLSETIFTFSRKGTGTATTYSIRVLPQKRVTDKDRENFKQFDGAEVETSFYETVLQPKTYEQQIKVLKDVGFPVKDHFDIAIGDEEADDCTPIDENDATKVI